MGGFIRSDVERVETKQISTTINKEVCEDFKDWCKIKGYPINVMIEIFMSQYVDGKFLIDLENAKIWNDKTKDKIVLNTTVDLKVFNDFKDCCKIIKYPINAMLTAFMKQFIDEEYVLEFRKVKNK